MLDPVEYSIGVAGGAELTHRAVLLDLDMSTDVVKIRLDVANTYNDYDRQVAVDELPAKIAARLPWVATELQVISVHVRVGSDGARM